MVRGNLKPGKVLMGRGVESRNGVRVRPVGTSPVHKGRVGALIPGSNCGKSSGTTLGPNHRVQVLQTPVFCYISGPY
jgi:hypothetical protein